MSRMQAKVIQHDTPSFVGIDVGKTNLDIFIHPDGKRLRIENNRKTIEKAIKELHRNVKSVVLEATGTYHRLSHTMLHEAGFAVSVVNPFRSC